MIDSRQKRSSVLGFNAPFNLGLPPPSGSIAQAVEQQVAFCYSGILALAPVIPPLPLYAAILNDRIGYLATVAA